ncbi:MAG: ribonuclease HII [Endomicrobium sp.]|jgi:ribonuclease HII|nr:ribonuclease HII [Endomicrobium sp.]
MNLFSFDKSFYDKNVGLIAGVDESGRGPLAGPVVAAAVVLPRGLVIPDLNDSKQLSEKKRKILFEIIKEKSLFYGVEFIDSGTIDKVNILQATFLAVCYAVAKLRERPSLCLIDGNRRVPGLFCEQETVVGGDSKSASIAAASVLAKVLRDKVMLEYSELYPVYDFKKHKGYGTKEHIEFLRRYGVSPIHRLSFYPVRDYIASRPQV